jgi:hypothetical protein
MKLIFLIGLTLMPPTYPKEDEFAYVMRCEIDKKGKCKFGMAYFRWKKK